MIQEKAMLANLTIRAWTARKLDRKVSAEVEQQHGAKDAGNFNKLLIDKNALQPLSQHGGRVRDYHYKMTLPWGDNGDRLLPSTAFMEYTAAMRTYRSEAEKLADDFAQQYPQMVSDARVKLGSMYDPKDYPPIGDIRERFGIALSFLPVPDANDFRVDVGAEAVQEIKDSITQAVAQRQQDAVKECWGRLFDVVSKIETMLVKEKPIFRDSLIENAEELIDLLPKLNITNDAGLLAVCDDIRSQLLVDPARLRRSARLRTETAKHAMDILVRVAERK
jgi:hypothetical protein